MDLHVAPPMTLSRLGARHRWLLPTALAVFVVLAAGAVFDLLVWDEPLTDWVVGARRPWLDAIVRRVSFLGSTKVVLVVAGVAALASAKRCPRLALAIVVIALARPLAEFCLKELISRDRPAGDRMVNGRGYSFPSGHPLATAASWCLLPLVVSLYTRRRILWWSVAISAWTLVILVAMSRVWLGVHWGSDVIAAIALAILGVAAAERLIQATHGGSCAHRSSGADADDVDEDVVDRPVLETAS
ncbi:MAG: phosphatase PAP2 family protein [Acidimicrobiales bacterium]|nr:phosphatase PAP2 family protein [Acidimicrobiales bacterium]